MSDGWTPPGAGSASQPPGEFPPAAPLPTPYPAPVAYPGPPAEQPAYYSGADPYQNWGLAYPGYPAQGYVVLVPRPPRPRAVTLAIQLTYFGLIISGIHLAFNSLYTWSNRDQLLAPATSGAPPGSDPSGIIDASLTIGLVIGVLFWMLPAAGTVVCVELSRRGKNAARIVLACLAGVFALDNLCGAGFGLIATAAGSAETFNGANLSFSTGMTWWTLPVQGLLTAIAITMLVLLLVPSANRYFSAGPGRRFAPSP